MTSVGRRDLEVRQIPVRAGYWGRQEKQMKPSAVKHSGKMRLGRGRGYRIGGGDGGQIGGAIISSVPFPVSV